MTGARARPAPGIPARRRARTYVCRVERVAFAVGGDAAGRRWHAGNRVQAIGGADRLHLPPFVPTDARGSGNRFFFGGVPGPHEVAAFAFRAARFARFAVPVDPPRRRAGAL